MRKPQSSVLLGTAATSQRSRPPKTICLQVRSGIETYSITQSRAFIRPPSGARYLQQMRLLPQCSDTARQRRFSVKQPTRLIRSGWTRMNGAASEKCSWILGQSATTSADSFAEMEVRCGYRSAVISSLDQTERDFATRDLWRTSPSASLPKQPYARARPLVT